MQMLTPYSKLFLVLGSINAVIAILLGAFAAHGLKKHLTEQLLSSFHTGVQYHIYHSLGLIAVGLIAVHISNMGIKISGWLMISGIVLFSGSLYVLALSGIRQFGLITPVGGICFVVAWAVLAVTIIRQ